MTSFEGFASWIFRSRIIFSLLIFSSSFLLLTVELAGLWTVLLFWLEEELWWFRVLVWALMIFFRRIWLSLSILRTSSFENDMFFLRWEDEEECDALRRWLWWGLASMGWIDMGEVGSR